jgi:hypothetical protein
MKPLPIKYTKDYLLLIDEEAEIKENTWYENNGVLFLSDEKYDDGNNPNNSNPIVTNYNNSVIAYYPLTKEATELDLPLLPNPFKEEEDIEKMAYNWLYDEKTEDKAREGYPLKPMEYGFIEGYKAAQSKQLENFINYFNEIWKKFVEPININNMEEQNSQITTEAHTDENNVLAVKSDWDLRKYFEQLRFDKNHHLGLGDIRLTIGQQEEICEFSDSIFTR